MPTRLPRRLRYLLQQNSLCIGVNGASGGRRPSDSEHQDRRVGRIDFADKRRIGLFWAVAAAALIADNV